MDMILIFIFFSCLLAPSSPAHLEHALELGRKIAQEIGHEFAELAEKLERPELLQLLKQNESNHQPTAHPKSSDHSNEYHSIPLMPDPEELLKAQQVLDLVNRHMVKTPEQPKRDKQQEPRQLPIKKNATQFGPEAGTDRFNEYQSIPFMSARGIAQEIGHEFGKLTEKLERPELLQLLKQNESNHQPTAHPKSSDHSNEYHSIPLMPDPEELLKAQQVLDLLNRHMVKTPEQPKRDNKQQELNHLPSEKNAKFEAGTHSSQVLNARESVSDWTKNLSYLGFLSLPITAVLILTWYFHAKKANEVQVDKSRVASTESEEIEMGDLDDLSNRVGHEWLADGHFSTLFKSQYRGNLVVIKRAKPESCEAGRNSLRNELKVMEELSKYNHQHIIKFRGHFEHLPDQLNLIYEYCPRGNLRNFLRAAGHNGLYKNLWAGGEERPIEFNDLCLFITQILEAMRFLSSKGIIHGDLAARNVLVFSRDLVKLSDFGLSFIGVTSSHVISSQNPTPLPIPWMPPEIINPGQVRHFTSKTDVWSFGVYIWEVFTFGRVPYEGIGISNIHDYLASGARLPMPESLKDQDNIWYEMMEATWKSEPKDRPSFEEISENLLLLKYINPAEVHDNQDSG